MSQSRNLDELLRKSLSYAIHYFENGDIPEEVRKIHVNPPIPNNINQGLTWAIYARQVFMGDIGKNNMSDESINDYLNALDNLDVNVKHTVTTTIPVQLHNKSVDHIFDIARLNISFLQNGFTEDELKNIPYRYRVIFDACIFTAIQDYLLPALNEEILNANEKQMRTKDTTGAEMEKVMAFVSKSKHLFEAYAAEHLIRPYLSFLKTNNKDHLKEIKQLHIDFLSTKYNITLKDDEINQLNLKNANNTGFIKANDFLQGLDYLSNDTTYPSIDRNSYGMIKLSVRTNKNSGNIPFLDNMYIRKKDDNYEIYFTEPTLNAGRNIYSNTTQIIDKYGDSKSFQVPNLLAIDILEHLKNIQPGYHGGLTDIQALSQKISGDCKSGNWNPDDFQSIVRKCQKRTTDWKSFLSGLGFFGMANARDPGVDLLYRAIAQYEENLKMYPGIKTLEQLMIAQQKRDLIKTFNSEINRLLPYFSSDTTLYKDDSNLKVDAYKLGSLMLDESGIDEPPNEVLTKEHIITNEQGKKYVNVETQAPATIGAALLSERGSFSPKSAAVWKEATKNYKHPSEILKKFIPQLAENIPKNNPDR